MDKKLNILLLASWYPNTILPNNGNFIQKHAQAIAQNCNVTCLHAISRNQKNIFEIEINTANGFDEVVVYYKKIENNTPIIGALQKLKRQQKAYQKGYHKIISKTKKIDLVHLNVIFPAGLFALQLKKKLNIPFIITEHWTAFLKNNPIKISSVEKYYIKKIAKAAAFICPVSEDLKKAMIKFGINNNYKIIPNVVDTSIFKFSKERKNNDTKRLLHISNLKDEHKNITGILNTIKKLSEIRSDFTLLIAGDGDFEAFKKKAINMNIPQGIIEFEGEKTTTEIAELMNQSDYFLLFSNYESFSVVIAESWLTGLPVITSKCGGLTNQITKENGVQVAIKNEAELLEKINVILSKKNIFDNKLIAQKAKEKYSYQTVSAQFLTLYNTVLKIE
ncbi:MAG: glycosyltransferase family 4 protein [Vicingaceae bacterium]